MQGEGTIKHKSRLRNWEKTVSLMNVGELKEVSFWGVINELPFRQGKFETSIWKCPAENIKWELRPVVMTRDTDLGILWSVENWMKKFFFFKIINSRQPKIIPWVAITFCKVGRNAACKDSTREVPEVEGNRMVCSQRKRKLQAWENLQSQMVERTRRTEQKVHSVWWWGRPGVLGGAPISLRL